MTDVVGYVDAVSPMVVVRTKSGDVVDIAPQAVISVRELSHTPVRNSEIRDLEHAAALAWPGVEQHWLNGWFLRAGLGVTSRANSAVPLDFSAQISDLPAVIDWYRARGLEPWLALPERLLPIRDPGIKPTRVMVRDIADADAYAPEVPADPTVTLLPRPDPAWLAGYQRDVPVEVLTAVVDGAVTFAGITEAAVGRGAVTTAPDGTRWLGISAVRVADHHRRHGHGRRVCSALLGWGTSLGAQRVYVEVLEDNSAAIALYASMGFRLHHSHRYVNADAVIAPTI